MCNWLKSPSFIAPSRTNSHFLVISIALFVSGRALSHSSLYILLSYLYTSLSSMYLFVIRRYLSVCGRYISLPSLYLFVCGRALSVCGRYTSLSSLYLFVMGETACLTSVKKKLPLQIINRKVLRY